MRMTMCNRFLSLSAAVLLASAVVSAQQPATPEGPTPQRPIDTSPAALTTAFTKTSADLEQHKAKAAAKGAEVEAAASGKTPASPAAAAAQTTAAATPAAVPPPAGAPFSYDAEGRRDPFVSLLARGSEPAPTGVRSGGLAGMLVADATVKGIVRDRSGFIAMLQGPDGKTYIVRAGEALADGSVKSMSADTVVFLQDVTDPLSPVKHREVRKMVRPTDGGR
jgi:Tfp pilus assembly protein PilP